MLIARHAIPAHLRLQLIILECSLNLGAIGIGDRTLAVAAAMFKFSFINAAVRGGQLAGTLGKIAGELPFVPFAIRIGKHAITRKKSLAELAYIFAAIGKDVGALAMKLVVLEFPGIG